MVTIGTTLEHNCTFDLSLLTLQEAILISVQFKNQVACLSGLTFCTCDALGRARRRGVIELVATGRAPRPRIQFDPERAVGYVSEIERPYGSVYGSVYGSAYGSVLQKLYY